MRIRAIIVALLGMGLLTHGEPLWGDSDKKTDADGIGRLIKQLGDDSFDRREAASKELVAIGEPARPALRKASSCGDLEVRRRAERALEEIATRAGKKELAQWEGFWKNDAGEWIKFPGDRWSCGSPGWGPAAGTLKLVEMTDSMTLVDLAVDEGPTKGGTVLAIFRRDGDTLNYCGTYTAARPTEFKTRENYYSCTWKRVKK
jgi:hypothetical protein